MGGLRPLLRLFLPRQSALPQNRQKIPVLFPIFCEGITLSFLDSPRPVW